MVETKGFTISPRLGWSAFFLLSTCQAYINTPFILKKAYSGQNSLLRSASPIKNWSLIRSLDKSTQWSPILIQMNSKNQKEDEKIVEKGFPEKAVEFFQTPLTISIPAFVASLILGSTTLSVAIFYAIYLLISSPDAPEITVNIAPESQVQGEELKLTEAQKDTVIFNQILSGNDSGGFACSESDSPVSNHSCLWLLLRYSEPSNTADRASRTAQTSNRATSTPSTRRSSSRPACAPCWEGALGPARPPSPPPADILVAASTPTRSSKTPGSFPPPQHKHPASSPHPSPRRAPPCRTRHQLRGGGAPGGARLRAAPDCCVNLLRARPPR